uniref:Stabilin 2 n=1 Tax=Sphaeramia orbicularis TaxID=375764 RepID=A0A673BJX9_9TELE
MSVWNLRRFEVPHRTTSFLPFLLLVILCRFGTAVYRTEQVCTEMVRFSMCTVTGLVNSDTIQTGSQPHSPVCRYHIRTPSMTLALKGCSFECYKEVEAKSCCPGFWGPDCIECPEEASRPCSHNGVCSDGVGGNGTCSCKEGFAGTACEICASGRYGPKCSSVCTCVHGLCNAGLNGDGTCMCFSGYKGPNCNQEVPECAALSCPSNSRCIEEAATGQLACQCMPGYRKDSPNAQCLSINPCLQRICHAQATCIHTGPNQHMCACNEGYSGDGHVCMAIDPCQTNRGGCSADSTHCVYDEPGKSHCECLSGFKQLVDGVCSLTDVCRPDSCHKNANCSTVAPGRFECTCLQGYVGNGKVCYGNIMQRLNELNTEPGSQWASQLNSAITLFESLSWPLQNLGPFTVFVPINKAFRGSSVRTLMANQAKAKYLCKMHLVAGVMPFETLKKTDVFYTLTGKSAETDTSEGTKIRIHGSRKKGVIIQSDVVASNGMIHFINKLMDSVSPTVDSDTEENLMKILSDYSKFDTFRTLLEKADLTSVIDSPGVLTVFAPTTAAFDAMKEGQLQYLNSADGQIQVNDAAVLEAAVEGRNGRLYVLDGVLIPPSIEPILPHRCDVTENKVIMVCSGISTYGCIYTFKLGQPPVRLPATGCSPQCNVTVTTAACCSGFFGADCSPCPGGYTTPCSGHGKCLDGLSGNGTCVCDPNFGGSRCHYCSSLNKYGLNCDKTCLCINGQCDNRPNSDGSCKPDSCLPGFTGRFCERQTAACGTNVQFCHAHAVCDFSETPTRCVCKPGFNGDGITCVESDPCAPPLRGGCSVNAKCIKTGVGTHTCQCLSGWREDGDDCQPINNCDSPDNGGCHPNATCIYVGPGQSDCSCKSGYKGNGRDCEAINQCVTLSGGCHYLASCRLISSQWKCVCDDGYTGNGQICYGTVEQVSDDASDFYTWTTSGMFWSLPEVNITLLVPSSDAVSKMSTDDRNFWTSKGNLPSLVRNHIIQGNYPLSSISAISSVTSLLKTSFPVSTSNEVTTVGGATITTPNIAATNGLIHIIDKVLVPDRKLSEGLLATLALRPDLSLFRSYIIKYNLTDEIQQTSEFTVFAPTDDAVNNYLKETGAAALDVNTTRYHVLVSESLLKTDLQQGGYKPTLLGFSFHLGIFPRDGKLFVNDAQINSSNILCGKGVIHTLSSVLLINRNRCDSAQYQKKLVRKRKCMLSRVFEEERLLTIGCRATCYKTNICCAGFFGEHCEPCPGPKGQPCFGNGACSDGINGTGVCGCFQGFNGTACETCQSGKYGVHCDQECKCKNGRCNEGLKGDGTCECDVGWRGILCDETDELCGSVKCHSSANCVFRPSGLQCLCAAGFEGNGTFCQAKDPCAWDNGGCSLYAVCKRTRPGQRQCVCNSGYTGDGLVCVEVNPCLEGNGGCHVNADCVHVGPNKTSCACSEGYEGDGQTCNMIDLCRKKNGDCHKYARCNMTGPGVRTCTCMSYYIGDGVTCKGTVGKLKPVMSDKYRDLFGTFLRSHIVMCHTLLAADLSQPRNLTTLSGVILSTRSSQGSIFINEANVTYSDDVSVNGIFHEINKFLILPDVEKQKPPDTPVKIVSLLNHSKVVSLNQLFTLSLSFFYLQDDTYVFQDTGVVDLVQDAIHQPITIFLPSDAAMASLPQQQKDFLFNPQNQAQLQEYLKYHILPSQKVYAEGLIHLDSPRTIQGSPLSFSCGGLDAIGDIFVNDGKCRIVQRHLIFREGIAYGIDCLLTPPSLGGRCDEQSTFELQMSCGVCSSAASRCPRGSKVKEVQRCDLPTMFVTRNSGCRSTCTVNFWQPKCCPGYYGRDCLVCPGGVGSPCNNRGKCDDGHLGNGTCTCNAGFGGVACELCNKGFYGPTCKACNCSEHGSCDDGRRGTGSCFCEAGWTGERLVDMCQVWNGGCAKDAKCSQKGEQVSCTCPKGYTGDGYVCLPIDPCADGNNGGCHEHAICTLTAPGKRKCSCKDKYIGDGVTCDVKQLPISRCLQDNGLCHQDAKCTDLHFEDATLGVFHLRSDKGQYKLNYTAAQQACSAVGGTLATYMQLSYAQQGGLNMCAAGWLDQARVSYPTTYANPNCGFGHVGIVDYGVRKNLSETWDTFCYRMKEVKCECKVGYIGDGFTCTGNLLQVLKSTPSFSSFLTQILNYSEVSASGKQFMKRLSNLTIQSTLFVPDNSGLAENDTLTQRDIEFHLSDGQVLPINRLKNGTRIRTRVGSLTALGVSNLLNPSSWYINDRFVTSSDIVASNGIIHVLQGPLKAPPPRQEMRVAHKAGMGVGVVLLIVLVVAVSFVGYHFYKHNTKPFQFHYFKVKEGACILLVNIRCLSVLFYVINLALSTFLSVSGARTEELIVDLHLSAL